jgi:hypothetical protein
MNTLLRSKIYLPMAAMILTASLAGSATVQKQAPFKGALQGHEIDTPQGGPPPTTLLVDGSATGVGTHVGDFSLSYGATVNLADGTATGSTQLIAANGDSILTTFAGTSEPTATPGIANITEINTIIGWYGSLRGSPGELHCRAIGKPGNGLHLRFVPRNHHFPRCVTLRVLSARARPSGRSTLPESLHSAIQGILCPKDASPLVRSTEG